MKKILLSMIPIMFFAASVMAKDKITIALARTPIDTVQTPEINGIKHYISLKGRDSSKPLLLFLHGGPGGSVMDYADKFTSKLQEEFVVVQWDQRETGKT